MTKQAKLVIIGAGIVGASCAYHLAKEGWRDIVILDKGQLPHNDGSTSHAPGGVVVASHSKLLTQFGQYTSQLLSELNETYEHEIHNMYNGVGGLELARTERRWNDLKRLHGECKGWGVETHLLTPQEAYAKLPLLNPTALKGALFVPESAIVRGTCVIDGLLKATQELTNLEILPYTYVEDVELKSGRMHAVITDNPDVRRIECEQALLCTNIWASAISDRIGVATPLMAFEHQYTITEPIDALKEFSREFKEQEVPFPTARDIDKTLYYRTHWDRLGVGSYYHKPHMISPHALTRQQTAMHDFTPDDFAAARTLAEEMIPALKGAQLDTKFNGMFAFSVDGLPIMGESKVPGFWVAVASWISHAGGVGKMMAQWMTHGDTEIDLRQANMHRFHNFQTTDKYVHTITSKWYAEVYDIIHPRLPLSEPRMIRPTPFYSRHVEQGCSFTAFAGMELPNWYEENSRLLEKYEDQIPARSGWGAENWSPIQGAEHLEVRNNVGMFDLCGLSIIELRGAGAMAFANQLCTNQLDVPIGEVVYTCWLNKNGGIRRDLTVARMNADTFWMFVGEGTLPQDLDWVERHAPDDGSVYVSDISSQYSGIGVWGPNARKVFEQVTPADVSNEAFPYYTWHWIEIGTARVMAMRISYAGELGWELHVPIDQSIPVWDALWGAGRDYSMILAGMGAFDSLRLEKGYRLWGGDIYTEYNLYEAGMRWTAKLKKDGGFIGRDATVAAKQQGIKRKLCCLTLDDPAATLFGYEPVFSNGTALGNVTTANYGYSIGKYIAYVYLPKEYTSAGTELEVEYFDQRFPAVVSAEPLYDSEMARMKA